MKDVAQARWSDVDTDDLHFVNNGLCLVLRYFLAFYKLLVSSNPNSLLLSYACKLHYTPTYII